MSSITPHSLQDNQISSQDADFRPIFQQISLERNYTYSSNPLFTQEDAETPTNSLSIVSNGVESTILNKTEDILQIEIYNTDTHEAYNHKIGINFYRDFVAEVKPIEPAVYHFNYRVENAEQENLKTVAILNISIHNLSLQELLAKLTKNGGFVVTPNVDHLMKLQKDQELLSAYQQADYRVCDSKILQYALKFLGTPISEKISGSDLFPAFYEYNRNNEDIRIFLLGGQAGIPEIARDKINAKVGRNIIIDAYSPSFGFEKNEEECQEIIARINRSGATVLAIGVGAPKQEKWIIKYRHLLRKVKIFLAIGATIDFEAGYKLRSPKWISEAGLEWLYRLASEPCRLWKRYLVESLPFFGLILQQKMQMLSHHSTMVDTTFSLSDRTI